MVKHNQGLLVLKADPPHRVVFICLA